MIDQDFNEKALQRVRPKGSHYKYVDKSGSSPITTKEWKLFLVEVSERIMHGDFRFERLIRTVDKRGRPVFSTKNLENAIVLRKINQNLRRAYGIRQESRVEVVTKATQYLSEKTPMTILRLDIRSFYESVPRRKLLERLKNEGRLNFETLNLLEQLFRYCAHRGAHGLPRGLQPSATLAELIARDITSDLRQIPGVYGVCRYVDDIIVFAVADAPSVLESAKSVVCRHGFLLNSDKTELHCINSPTVSKGAKIMHSIDFLGYKLVVSPNKSKELPNNVGVLLSDRKLRKHTRRLISATMSFRKTGDHTLLADRCQFLAANYPLDSRKGGTLMGGIYYNYRMYTDIGGDLADHLNSLGQLDISTRRFLRGALSTAPYIPRSIRRKILSISALHGHLRRHTLKFGPKRIKEVTECWND